MPGGPVKPRRTETTLEQPGSSIATPYIPSAVSMVRLLRVIADEPGLFGHLAEQSGRSSSRMQGRT
jgi:hypothetical protein